MRLPAPSSQRPRGSPSTQAGSCLPPPASVRCLVFADTAYLVPIAAAVLLSAWAATRVPKGLRGFWVLVSARVRVVARR